MSTNKCFISGRLGADPEVRYTQNQKRVTTLSVATSEWSKERGEETTWHKVVCWGKAAETCENSLQKGSQVLVEGTLKNNNWTGPDGTKHYATEIHTFHVTVLQGKTDNQVPTVPEFPVEATPATVVKPTIEFDISTDQIPF